MKRTMTLLMMAALVVGMTAAVQARAWTENWNCQISFGDDLPPLYVYDCCTDECVCLTGTIHLSGSITKNDNTFHLRCHTNFSDVKGEGCEPCNQYVANGASNFTLNINDCKGGEVTFVDHFNLIGRGSLCNLKVKVLLHLTVNANGEPTAEVWKFDAECQGDCGCDGDSL